MQKLIFTLLSLLIYASPASAQKKEQTFQEKLIKYAGESFVGKIIYPVDDNYPFGNKELVNAFIACSDVTTAIAFNIGEDQTLTWLLTKTPAGLQLKHDDRQADGTPDYFTMYGGISEEPLTSLEHFFPADEQTAELQPGAAGSEWTISISPDGQTLSYKLSWNSELRYHLAFDLTKPIN